MKVLSAFILVITVTGLQADASPRWSVRTHPGLIAGLKHADYVHERISPADIPPLLEKPEFSNQIDAFLDLCVQKGISEVIVDALQPELAGIYFRSEILERLGWKPLPDVFGLLRSKAASRTIEIGMSLSELGIQARGFYSDEYPLDKLQPLQRSDFEPFIGELVEQYGIASVTEEEFPASWLGPFQEASERRQLRYIHRGNTDDIVAFAGVGQRTTPIKAYNRLKILSSRDYYPLAFPGQESGMANGSLQLLFSIQGEVEASPWFSGQRFLENALRFRALQFAPDEFVLLVGPDELAAVSPDLLRNVDEFHERHDSSRPILNIVIKGEPKERLDPGHIGWLQSVSNLEPILLGAGAAGFRTLLSATPLGEAAAYYVYLAGPSVTEWIELERKLAGVEKKPVVLQFGSAPSEDVFWRVMGFLEIKEGKWNQGILPTAGMFRNQKVNFQGLDLYEGNIPTGYVRFKPDLRSILMVDPGFVPLIYQHPKIATRFFINGNLLHREMAFPVSQLLTDGRGLQNPSTCFIAVGKKTAFWALEDTHVDWINPQTGENVVLEMKGNGFYVK